MNFKKILILSAIILVVGAAFFLILFRNSPHFVETEKQARQSALTKSEEFNAPSKSNVAPAFSEQVAQLKKSVEENPSNASHLKALAQLLMDGHQHKEAIQYFEKAAALQPQNDSLLLDLSVCYFNDRNYEKALQITNKILKRDKYNAHALYNKGAILATEGKKSEAKIVWDLLVHHNPNSDEAKTVKEHISVLEGK